MCDVDYLPQWGMILMIHEKVLQTVVETPEFIKQSQAIAERKIVDEFIYYIARNPLKGDLIQGTGGVRKIRWNKNNHSGKSGGMRVLYYYHDQSMPIFLFTAYTKNQKANIGDKDKTLLKKMIQQLVKIYKSGKKHE